MLLPGVVSAYSVSSSTSQSVEDNLYYFGGNGNTPVRGDWNGDGKIEVGSFIKGVWYLDNNGDGAYTSGVDKTFNFGSTGFTPVVGDWNGNGKDKIGVYKDGAWYLDYLGEGAWTAKTKVCSFGSSGWKPVVGDWNNNGKTKIGVFKDKTWYLDYTGVGKWSSKTKTYYFGNSGWKPVLGDWNGDGRTKVGVYNNGIWYVDTNGDGIYNQETEKKSFGVRGWTPVVGDWDGNGRTELAVSNGYIWNIDMNGDGVFYVSSAVDKKPAATQTISPTQTSKPEVISSIPSSAIYLTDFGIKGDGSDETAKLQSALDYAGAHSSKAVVFPADKTIGISRTIESPAYVELIGNGCTIKLIAHSGMAYGDSLFIVGAHSYVHHMKFNGNMDNQDDTPNGVYLLTDSRFENNEVFKVSAYMLGTYKGDNIIINNNIIHDTRQYGIATSGEGGVAAWPNDYSNNITITNNIIYNCGQVGIKIRQTSNSLVKGNIITVPTSLDDDAPAGIRLYTFDGGNKGITITNNQISGPGDGSRAITSDNSLNTGIKIINNIITNSNEGIIINFNSAEITGNIITYRSACIVNRGSGNTISGNSCN